MNIRLYEETDNNSLDYFQIKISEDYFIGDFDIKQQRAKKRLTRSKTKYHTNKKRCEQNRKDLLVAWQDYIKYEEVYITETNAQLGRDKYIKTKNEFNFETEFYITIKYQCKNCNEISSYMIDVDIDNPIQNCHFCAYKWDYRKIIK